MSLDHHNRNITHRRSEGRDAEAVFKLVAASARRLAPDPYPQGVVDTWMAGRTVEDYRQDCADRRIWIAEFGRIPIGFAHAVPGEVKRLFVDTRHAGKGVGQSVFPGRGDDLPPIDVVVMMKTIPADPG